MLTIRALISLAAALAAFAAAPARAADPQCGRSLKEVFLESRAPNRQAAQAARFKELDGGSAFVLDRRTETPLLQFDGSYEVYALSFVGVKQGELVFRLDTGEELFALSAALCGGTLHPPGRATGVFAVYEGAALPIPPLGENAPPLEEAAAALQAKLAELKLAAALDIAAPLAAAPVFADAARLAAAALAKLALEGDAGGALARLKIVTIRIGETAEARLEAGEALVISVAPDAGYAGRPSSRRIAEALRGGRAPSPAAASAPQR